MQTTKINIRQKKSVVVIDSKDIILCNAEGRYTNMKTVNGSIFITKNIGAVESMLKNKCFCRIHQSYIINLNFVSEYCLSKNIIKLNNNETISISLRKKKKFKQLIQGQL